MELRDQAVNRDPRTEGTSNNNYFGSFDEKAPFIRFGTKPEDIVEWGEERDIPMALKNVQDFRNPWLF